MSLINRKENFRTIIIFLLINAIYSHIVVKSPKELSSKFENSSINVGLSSFGNIPYGHTIIGNLYYKSDGTEDENRGCDAINFPEIPISPKVDESPILLIDRGNCSFVTKVRNAQNAYAHAVIIADNIPNQNVGNVIMGDDGRGNEVTIPSVLISFEDGMKLKQYISAHKNDPKGLEKIVLEIDFEMEKADNTVEYDFWYTPDQEEAYLLLKDLYKYHEELGNFAKLNVHFVTYSHYSYKPNEKATYPDCYSGGKYCLGSGKFGTKNGKTILHEVLVQKCVHKYAYDHKINKTNLYWKYMESFYNECLMASKFDSTCSNYALKLAGLPTDQINKCVVSSFETTSRTQGYEDITENTILNEELELRKSYFVYGIPRLFVNGRMFLGNLRADNVFEALCAGLKKKPEVCYLEGGFEKTKKNNVLKVIGIILFIVIINVIIFCFCMKVIRSKIQERLDASDINRKIDTVVNSYLQMRDTK